MDAELLISFVKENTPLWDMKDPRYHQRDVQRKLWGVVTKQVAAEDVADVKKRWKGLRDVFRREFVKYLKSGQEAPDEFVSAWPYFNHMLFLRDVMEPRNLKGNLGSPNKDDTTGSKSSSIMPSSYPAMTSTASSTTTNDGINPQSPPMPPPQTAPPGPKNKKIRGSSHEEELLQIERQKLRLFTDKATSSQDSDYQFLISLHPFLKAVPDREKLAVRQKLQQVLLDVQKTVIHSNQSSPSAWTVATDDSSAPLSWGSNTGSTPTTPHGPDENSNAPEDLRDYYVNFPQDLR